MFYRKIIMIFACLMLTSCFTQSDDAGLLRHIVAEPGFTGEWVVHKWGSDDMSVEKDRTLRVTEQMHGNNPAYKVESKNTSFTANISGPVTFFSLGHVGFMYTGYPSNCEGCYLLRYEVIGDSLNFFTLNAILAAEYLEKLQVPQGSISYNAYEEDNRIDVRRFDEQGIHVLGELASNADLWSLHSVLKRN